MIASPSRSSDAVTGADPRDDSAPRRPYAAQFATLVVPPQGSTDMRNPDTSTWRRDTEDADT